MRELQHLLQLSAPASDFCLLEKRFPFERAVADIPGVAKRLGGEVACLIELLHAHERGGAPDPVADACHLRALGRIVRLREGGTQRGDVRAQGELGERAPYLHGIVYELRVRGLEGTYGRRELGAALIQARRPQIERFVRLHATYAGRFARLRAHRRPARSVVVEDRPDATPHVLRARIAARVERRRDRRPFLVAPRVESRARPLRTRAGARASRTRPRLPRRRRQRPPRPRLPRVDGRSRPRAPRGGPPSTRSARPAWGEARARAPRERSSVHRPARRRREAAGSRASRSSINVLPVCGRAP